MSSAVGRGNRGKPTTDANNVSLGGNGVHLQYAAPIVQQPGIPTEATMQHSYQHQQQYPMIVQSAPQGQVHQQYGGIYVQQPQMAYTTRQAPFYGYPGQQEISMGYDPMVATQMYPTGTPIYPMPNQARQPPPAANKGRERKILTITDPKTNTQIDIKGEAKHEANTSVVNGQTPPKTDLEEKAQQGRLYSTKSEGEPETHIRKEFTQQVIQKINEEDPKAVRSRTQSRSDASFSIAAPIAAFNHEVVPEPAEYQHPVIQPIPQRTPERETSETPATTKPVPESEILALAAKLSAAQLESAHALAPVKSSSVPPVDVPSTAEEPIEEETFKKEDSLEETEREEDILSDSGSQIKDEPELSKEPEDEAEKLMIREKELDSQVEELLKSPEEVDVAANFYGRSFLVTLRTIEKELKRTPCPLSVEQLNGFGLDINAMPKTGEKKTANFNPSWNTGNKPRAQQPYRGRVTTDGSGRGGRTERGGHMKRPPGPRPSIDRVIDRPKLATSKNAWKPDRLKNEELPEEVAKAKELCKKIRSLMNKITPTTKDELTKEFISLNVSANEDTLKMIVEIIFDKAIEEPKFCSLYAEVCKQQVDHELKINNKQSPFRNRILTRAQETFYTKTQEKEEKLEKIEAETDIAKKTELQISLIEDEAKFRRRKFGNITYIGHLFRFTLLSPKIITACLFDLLKNVMAPLPEQSFEEDSVHCALSLIETVGPILDAMKDSPKFLDSWFDVLERSKSICSNKIRFMIMNLAELRKAKWVHRKSVETGPKKITDIHKDAKQEQTDAVKERDNYDRRHNLRPSSNSLRKNPPVGRSSLDNRQGSSYRTSQPTEQRRANAAANTKYVSTGVQPKKVSLADFGGDGKLGVSQRKWHSGATGGGMTANSQDSAQPKANAWGRREGSNPRKASGVDERQQALAAAKEIAAGTLASRRSTSQTSVATDIDEAADSQAAEEQRELHRKIMNTVKSDIGELCSGDLKLTEMSDGLLGMVGQQKYGAPSLVTIFEYVMRAATEKALKPEEKKQLGFVVCETLRKEEVKKDFIMGVSNFCRDAVDEGVSCDFPNLWKNTGEVLVYVMHCPHDVVEGALRTNINDFSDSFVAATSDIGDKGYQLIVTVLKKLAEAEVEEKVAAGQEVTVAEGMAWEFAELAFLSRIDREKLNVALAECEPNVPGSKSLLELLTAH
ncbi:unnamed protein product [Caenorhabditis auriculariae]|uniref:MIF4G domain-containing protein n=1 Tax=Caenorhabditis auriculariae TaxID=2777116 RepID=A0A8S1HVX9_9PELO|nr:unnamed protein product [Caenorhabditis auriculariae]